MPSPIGHGLAGLIVHVLSARNEGDLRSGVRVAFIVGAALAPDLDLLVGLVGGGRHHQQQSHSVGFAILAAVAASLAARALRRPRPLALGMVTGAAWLSHILLDYLAEDTSPPIGIMALWPFSSGYFHFPWPIFLDIWRTLEWPGLKHDALAVAWEVLLLLPLLFLAWGARARVRA